ncbi:hypothetical protein GCM10017687_78770 [Streptomyces echinatus]
MLPTGAGAADAVVADSSRAPAARIGTTKRAFTFPLRKIERVSCPPSILKGSLEPDKICGAIFSLFVRFWAP